MSSSTTTAPTTTQTVTGGALTNMVRFPYPYVVPMVLSMIIFFLGGFYYRSVLLRRRQHLLGEFIQNGMALPGGVGEMTYGITLSRNVRAVIESRSNRELKPRMWEAFVEKRVDIDSEVNPEHWEEMMPFSGTYLTEAEDEDGNDPGDHRKRRLWGLFHHRGPRSVSPSISVAKNAIKPGILSSSPQKKVRIAVLVAMPSVPVPVPVPEKNATETASNTEDKPVLPHLEFGVIEVDTYYYSMSTADSKS
ncbi:hypothetical protein H0H92_009518 [Tricholoma furcatifolium]|nr:hypothetical protein H0H92_009518 [Tricholoma furcatifolium]